MRLWTAAHAVDDVYQGLVPACVPYFVLDRHYGYVAASGLTLAATLGAALPQLVVGFAVDRYSLGWMAGAGVSLAGIGLGMSGIVPGYALVWMLLFASGLGVAMFHPAAGKAARYAAMEGAGEVRKLSAEASAMSIFATGGNVGFFLAPVLATPALNAVGLGATVLFIPPAVLTGFVLRQARPGLPPQPPGHRRGRHARPRGQRGRSGHPGVRRRPRGPRHASGVHTLVLLPVPAVALSLLLPEPVSRG